MRGGGYLYYRCPHCGSIFISPEILDEMNKGSLLVKYNAEYWKEEYQSAICRCYGAGLARLAEAFYYCKRPIRRFLDIGSGSGKILDAIGLYLPTKKDLFYAIEKYPPARRFCTWKRNFIRGDYEQLLKQERFDCGMCIEVVEHLTPQMLVEIFGIIAQSSNIGALYLINSGFSTYVESEDEMYLDPFIRGHIVSYSAQGLYKLLSPLGFDVIPVHGKRWLIAIEYVGTENILEAVSKENIVDRIWRALPENKETLADKKRGSVLQILGLESARAY